MTHTYPGKRLFDLLISIPALIVFCPVMLIVAILVRVKLGTPVVFAQERPGLHGKLFTLYKFRTMTDQRGPDGELLLDKDRLTPFGAFLRRASLDELPALFNVLRGDMSLVGPRPLLTRYLPYYREREQLRHTVRPGITGWAQINGRNELSWDQRLEHDAWYAENLSFGLDLRILVATLGKVFQRSGVVPDARSIMLNLDEERATQQENK